MGALLGSALELDLVPSPVFGGGLGRGALMQVSYRAIFKKLVDGKAKPCHDADGVGTQRLTAEDRTAMATTRSSSQGLGPVMPYGDPRVTCFARSSLRLERGMKTDFALGGFAFEN